MTYGVYLASSLQSEHETFGAALAAYSRIAHLQGANLRSPHSDDESRGFSEDEALAIEAVEHAASQRERTHIDVTGHTFVFALERPGCRMRDSSCDKYRVYRCGDVQLAEDMANGWWRCTAGGKVGAWYRRPIDALLDLSSAAGSWAPVLAAFSGISRGAQ